MTTRPTLHTRLLIAALLALSGSALARAQDQAATPPPSPPATPATTPAADAPAAPIAPDDRDVLGRRVHKGEPAVLSFRSAAVSELIPLIVEYTGKVVMPQQDVLARRITVVSDRAIPRDQALDLVFLALQQIGVAVVETPDIVFLRDQAEVDRQNVPVLGPDVTTLTRPDQGTVVQKVYSLKSASAANLGEIIKGSLPDFAKLTVDLDSNQIVITGPIALLQRMERLIVSLDRPSAAGLVTETFKLKYADSDLISQNLRELFSDNSDSSRGAAQRSALQNTIRQFTPQGGNQRQGGQPGQPGGQAATGQPGQPAPSTGSSLRVTSNKQQNAVTVLAEPAAMEKIRKQVDIWDQPLPEAAVIPRVFQLQYSDPIKVRDTLDQLFGSGAARAGGGGGGGNTQGVGRLAGQFSFQAIPEAQRVIVVAKSPDNLDLIEKIIKDLDQPRSAGLPRIVELKHATAEDLAEQLNALLAQEGTPAQIRRINTGLSSSAANASPFASTSTTSFSSTPDGGFQQQTSQDLPNLQFWWQRARPPTADTGASTLVAKIRIVPVARQNALMILAPTEYADAVVQIINQLDRPGRQVLIKAVVAEISGDDFTALGLRMSSSTITPTRTDNTIGFTPGTTLQGGQAVSNQTITGQKNNLLPGLFDTSVLNIGVNVQALLQALAQTTSVTILSEPKIYTGDNIEASFFDGQDIPFITQSQTNTTGNGVIQSFDYRAVGIQLRVRPRITQQRDVDVKINLQLSSFQPQSTLFGGFIIDRRETTTQLIVQDGQTVVLSGILRSEDSDIKRKVPLLGDIPFLGALFTNIERTKTNTELVAFITPIVVENPEEAERINVNERLRLEQLRQQIQPQADPATRPLEPAKPAPLP